MFRTQYWLVGIVIALVAASRDGAAAFIAFLLVFWLLSAWVPRRS